MGFRNAEVEIRNEDKKLRDVISRNLVLANSCDRGSEYGRMMWEQYVRKADRVCGQLMRLENRDYGMVLCV